MCAEDNKKCLAKGNTIMKENILASIEISENKTIFIYSDYLEWWNEKILYHDIDGLAYKWTATDVHIYFIPVGTANRYYIGIRHHNKVTRINFPSSTFGGTYGSKSSENFLNLSKIVDEVIKPTVITNLLAKYSETGKLEIANLRITSEGIYKKTWLGDRLLSYAEYHGSFINQGDLYISYLIRGIGITSDTVEYLANELVKADTLAGAKAKCLQLEADMAEKNGYKFDVSSDPPMD